ncbi:MAG: carboxypeptidase regulatory-like domain-containing protein [Vicinamibacteria bacterium]
MNLVRKGRRAAWLAVLIPALVVAAGTPAWAQKTVGEVRGTVADTSGAVLPGATVTLTNVNTGYTRDVATDAKGDFVFPVVDPGSYRVDVTLQGFRKYSQMLSVSALQTASILPRLEVGGLQEAVEVTAVTEGVNTTSGGVTQNLKKEVLEMPNLNHYGFANATLMPAIQQSEERRETINASVAGNSSNRNAFYIDGAEATDPWRGWSPRQPVADAFEEIVVNTAGATVDVGSNFGGTYNAIFKSGTNQFHGSAWYFFRDSGLNANSWVNNRVGLAKPDDPLKYWGGQVGGPIIKDKLFFYFTGNRETDKQPYSQTGLFAPTSAMIGGDFSGVPFTIYDPTTGQPFPGNRIPAARIDPVAKAFWDKYGYDIPSYGPNYSFQFANERKVWNFNGRIDYNISQSHRLTLSGYYFDNKTTSPDARVQSISGSPTGGTSGNTFQKGGNELSDFPQTVLNAKWTWTPKSNLVIETRAAYSSMPEKVVLAEDSLGTTLQTLGANDPLPRADAPAILPTINIGEWWGGSEGAVLFNGWTTDFTVKNLTLGSSATWIKGSHSIKLGAEFQDGNFNTIKPARDTGGAITFNGNVTSQNNPSSGGRGATFAHSFADFLLGRFDSYSQGDGFDQTLQSWNLGVYLMDTWRVTPRLTVTPGLRLEVNSGISEIENRLTMYRPGLQSTLYPSFPNGVVVAGDAGLPNSFSGTSTKLAPRLNFAYDVTGDGKTAVRGSVGIYYGRDVMALYETYFMHKPPFTGGSVTARNGVLSNPWLTSQNPAYTSIPLPLTDQNPASYQFGSQVSGLRGISEDYGLGSSTQWNLAVEREILRGVKLEASYQGNSSTSTPTGVPTNLPVWASGASDSGSSYQERRPDQFLGDNGGIVTNDGRTRFDQFLLLARARRSGLFAQLSWAYTHARRNFAGTGSSPGGIRDWDSSINIPWDLGIMQDFQNGQTIAGFFTWDLPFLRHSDTVAGKILGDWSLTANGFWNFANKGQTVSVNYDANANNWGDDFAKVNGTVSYPKTAITGQGDLLYQWVDPGAFVYPNGTLNRTFSSAVSTDGINVIDQLPWSWRVDAGLMKNFRIAGDAKLQFRAEVFNLFNHANLNGPNLSVGSSDFGTIRGKYGDGRRVQLGFRFVF